MTALIHNPANKQYGKILEKTKKIATYNHDNFHILTGFHGNKETGDSRKS